MMGEKLRAQEEERIRKEQARCRGSCRRWTAHMHTRLVELWRFVAMTGRVLVFRSIGASGKSFNAKEKLKRSRGQSGRGKSAVEEEKRLLKNMPGGGGFGFD